MLDLFRSFGLRPSAVAGHSYGEFVALHAAGVFSLDSLAELSVERGRFMLAAGGREPGGMAAIGAGAEAVEALVNGSVGVVLANRNGPSQTVVSGPNDAIAGVVAKARERGLRAQSLSVAAAFHSPLVAGASIPLRDLVARHHPATAKIPVYSNVTAAPYGPDSSQIPAQLGDHLAKPVRFAAMIEAMYADKTSVFVEVGAGSVLTSLIGSILGDRPHLAVATEPAGRKGLSGFLNTLGRLFVGGIDLDLTRLTAGRSSQRVQWTEKGFEPTGLTLSASTWIVNGNRSRPAFGPEPIRFGPGLALPKPEPKPEVTPPQTAAVPSRNGHAPKSKTSMPKSTHLEANGTLPSAADEVFDRFQSTMRNFLDVQRTTMLAYLASGAGATPQRHSESLGEQP